MSEKNHGEQVFPTFTQLGDRAISKGGLTLLDWFAGQALAGTMASGCEAVQSKEQAAFIAAESYLMANAMLEEKEKHEQRTES